eukprot:TRINITY_DN11576_c0_g1_i1.p1 TRINITY_DN11576_c0_g1~~TRINITY_DN11576_c0_g1_i1.p1  ORF type:complete len:968 (+),score=177.26 TRINITY_DN11576_c0_g1_i1:336-2906(+)
MSTAAMTMTLKTLLANPKRRQTIKITAYKEIIRLLASRPIPAHIDLIKTEWRRKGTHRDVMVTIVQQAVRLLRRPSASVRVWEVLVEAAKDDQPVEIRAALLGAHPETATNTVEIDDIARTPRLMDYYAELSKAKVPTHYCEQFLKEIVLPMATSDHDDIKHLAVLLLPMWLRSLASGSYDAAVSKQALEALASITSTVSDEVLDNPRPAVQRIWNARFNGAVSGLREVSTEMAKRAATEKKDEIKYDQYLADTLTVLVKAEKATGIKERNKRSQLRTRITTVANAVKPPTAPRRRMRGQPATPTVEKQVVSKMMITLATMGYCHWEIIADVAINYVEANSEVDSLVETASGMIYVLLKFAALWPSARTGAAQRIQALIKKADTYQASIQPAMYRLLEFLVDFATGDADTSKLACSDVALSNVLGVNDVKLDATGLAFAKDFAHVNALQFFASCSYGSTNPDAALIAKLISKTGSFSPLRQEIVGYGLTILKKLASSSQQLAYYGNRYRRRIPSSLVKTTAKTLLQPCLSAPNSASLEATASRTIATALAQDSGMKFILAEVFDTNENLSALIAAFVHSWEIQQNAALTEKVTHSDALTCINGLIGAIESKHLEILHEESEKDLTDRKDWELCDETMDLILKLIIFAKPAVNAKLHAQVAFEVFCEKIIPLILSREDEAKKYIDDFLQNQLYSLGLFGAESEYGKQEQKLQRALGSAFSKVLNDATTKVRQLYQDDEERKVELEKANQAVATRIAQFATWVNNLKCKSPARVTCLSVGFDLVKAFGSSLKVVKETEDEEAEEQEEGTAAKSKKNKLVEMTWRPEFETLLDFYCTQTEAPLVASMARDVIIKSFQSS